MSQPKTLTFNTQQEFYKNMDFMEFQEFVGGYFELYPYVYFGNV